MKEKIKKYYIDLVQGRRKGAPDALFCFFLLLLSFIYGFFVRLILFCYEIKLFKSYKPDCRVISVGNISWGGTGKTPLVESIAGFLKENGKKPAVLIRGYGKDEVYMLQDKFKDIAVLAGRDRVKNAGYARQHHGADTIILDDGFQHWRIKRDLDIVLIDAQMSFGNSRLIPRGILREPLSSLNRADIFVLTRTNMATEENIESIKGELRKYNSQAPIYEAVHTPTFFRSLSSNRELGLSGIKGKRLALIAGVANPESIAGALDSLGAEVALKFYFTDHYRYRKEDFARIKKQCLGHQIETIVTTEKDAAKLNKLIRGRKLEFEVWVLGVEFKIIDRETEFLRYVKGDKICAEAYSILILSDGKAGHLNQSKAVTKIIGERLKDSGICARSINSKIAEVQFKNGFLKATLGLCSIFAGPYCRICFCCLRFCLQKDSFYELIRQDANIIVSAGSSLSPVNLLLSYRNKARKIILMKPSFLNLNRFDLIITPEHDRIKANKNVLLTRIAPNLIDRKYLGEQANILKTKYSNLIREQVSGPTIGVLIGGDTAKFRLTPEIMDSVILQLKNAAGNLNCRILITTSRRTPKTVEELLKKRFANFEACKLLVIANESNIPEAVGGILGLSDIVLVSGESISMVSEAVSAEKYTLVFMPESKTGAPTKQERFLEKLEQERILKIIPADNLISEIEEICKARPERRKIPDKELIYQALGRVLRF